MGVVRGLTCQVERWKGWKSGGGKRQELCALGCGVHSCDGDEQRRSRSILVVGLLDAMKTDVADRTA